jgi:oxalate decarboxylase/phosphoglucose isomerase-like protein (cupin superfamily)
MGHYIENTGGTPLRFLEMFKSSYCADVSLNQWLALAPRGGERAPQAGSAGDERFAKAEVAGCASLASPALLQRRAAGPSL